MGLIQLPKDSKKLFNKNVNSILSGNLAENYWNDSLRNFSEIKLLDQKGQRYSAQMVLDYLRFYKFTKSIMEEKKY